MSQEIPRNMRPVLGAPTRHFGIKIDVFIVLPVSSFVLIMRLR